jgi:predicted NAD/FAD-dependent oxidoreductase
MSGVDVVVVGAGLAGTSAARRLADAGLDVVVLERDRWVGGRLGTRLVGTTVVDHGAQFFTARNRRFGDWVDTLLSDDLVYEWCRGFGANDGFPRFVARGGMGELARVLARDLTIRLDRAVRSVSAGAGDRWLVELEGDGPGADDAIEARAVLLTAPVPQSLEILEAGGVDLGHDEAEGLPLIDYEPTLALVTVLDRSPSLPRPGAVQRDVGPFSFVADNQAKGLADAPALTLHASAAMSNTLWTESDTKVTATLLLAAEEYVAGRKVLDTSLTRWRYATPQSVWTNRCCTITDDPGPLLLAGDAFGGPRVEGAWLSGDAAATAILKRLGVDAG